MELKDFIVMIVPIVVESIIIFYVQAVMTRKLERGGGVVLSMLDRLKDIKYKALKLFGVSRKADTFLDITLVMC